MCSAYAVEKLGCLEKFCAVSKRTKKQGAYQYVQAHALQGFRQGSKSLAVSAGGESRLIATESAEPARFWLGGAQKLSIFGYPRRQSGGFFGGVRVRFSSVHNPVHAVFLLECV